MKTKVDWTGVLKDESTHRVKTTLNVVRKIARGSINLQVWAATLEDQGVYTMDTHFALAANTVRIYVERQNPDASKPEVAGEVLTRLEKLAALDEPKRQEAIDGYEVAIRLSDD